MGCIAQDTSAVGKQAHGPTHAAGAPPVSPAAPQWPCEDRGDKAQALSSCDLGLGPGALRTRSHHLLSHCNAQPVRPPDWPEGGSPSRPGDGLEGQLLEGSPWTAPSTTRHSGHRTNECRMPGSGRWAVLRQAWAWLGTRGEAPEGGEQQHGPQQGGQAASTGADLPKPVTFAHLTCSPPGWTDSPCAFTGCASLPNFAITHGGIHTAAERPRPETLLRWPRGFQTGGRWRVWRSAGLSW